MDPSKDSDEIVNGVRVIRFHRQGHAVTGIHLGIREWLMRNATPDKYISPTFTIPFPPGVDGRVLLSFAGLPVRVHTHYHGMGNPGQGCAVPNIPGLRRQHLPLVRKNICVSNFEKDLVQGDFDCRMTALRSFPTAAGTSRIWTWPARFILYVEGW